MGGVLTDAHGRTSLDGLWAAGEVTSTGAHGANRLASNSLLEAVVFASLVADDINRQFHAPQIRVLEPLKNEAQLPKASQPKADLEELRNTMSHYVGVERNREGLVAALRIIDKLEKKIISESFRNQIVASKLITVAALLRTESRGGHYRTDYPNPSPIWQKRTYMTLRQAEAVMADILKEAASEETTDQN